MNHPNRQIRVVLELPRAEPEAGIRGLRWLLKRLLRGYGVRCIRLEESSERGSEAIRGLPEDEKDPG
jgi:hypothetical protein